MDRGAAEETVLIRSLLYKLEKPVSFLGSRLSLLKGKAYKKTLSNFNDSILIR
jgi:hypothetical protein